MKKLYCYYLILCLFVLMPVGQLKAQRIRKNYREMSPAEINTFVNALYALKQSGKIDEYANLHAELFNQGIHHSPVFLPWHRWFIYHFEEALQNTGLPGAAFITLPYWDWTSRYYNLAPTDAQTTAPLWDNNFLGQFNLAWNLNRTLDGGMLPMQSDITGLLSLQNFSDFTLQLEGYTHGVPHMWVGGVMSGRGSPGDPVFYMHHNMVDKVWQDWTNFGQLSPLMISMPRFPSGVASIDPNSIADSRAIKVWFAENNNVNVYRYSVRDTETYVYSGTISASDFEVPAATECNMASEQQIRLRPGFKARTGSKLHVAINNPGAVARIAAAPALKTHVSHLPAKNEVNVFPNPSTRKFNVLLFSDEVWEKYPVPYFYEVYDLLGRTVVPKNSSGQSGLFQVDLADQPRGIYLLKITFVTGKTRIQRLTLSDAS